MSIAFRSIGFIGKLFGEALEEAQHRADRGADRHRRAALDDPREGLLAAGRAGVLVVALLRWDINIRESAVLGLVGAGGIGVALDAALNIFTGTRSG